MDLENLDASPDDLLDLLKESQSQVWVWTKLATEYWRRGYLDAAEKLAQGAVECMWRPLWMNECSFILYMQSSDPMGLPPRCHQYTLCWPIFS